MKPLIAVIPLMIAISPLSAGEVEIIDAKATPTGKGIYRIDVTLRHEDSGWDHYADGWEVLDPAGNQLGQRVLHHPHVKEQPFTRSLTGQALPDNLEYIEIRAHDSEHGYTKEHHRVRLK